jgi:hypothetical protein
MKRGVYYYPLFDEIYIYSGGHTMHTEYNIRTSATVMIDDFVVKNFIYIGEF